MAKITTYEKQPDETRLFNFDFKPKMETGETILSVDSTVTDPAGITFGTTTINAQNVEILVSGGTGAISTEIEYNTYKLTVIVTTSLGQILELDVLLNIKDI